MSGDANGEFEFVENLIGVIGFRRIIGEENFKNHPIAFGIPKNEIHCY